MCFRSKHHSTIALVGFPKPLEASCGLLGDSWCALGGFGRSLGGLAEVLAEVLASRGAGIGAGQ